MKSFFISQTGLNITGEKDECLLSDSLGANAAWQQTWGGDGEADADYVTNSDKIVSR